MKKYTANLIKETFGDFYIKNAVKYACYGKRDMEFALRDFEKEYFHTDIEINKIYFKGPLLNISIPIDKEDLYNLREC